MGFTSRITFGPILIVLSVLGLFEIGAVHLLVMHWSSAAAWTLTSIGLVTSLYMIAVYRSLKTRPSEVREDALLVRLGRIKEVRLDYANIESIHSGEGMAAPDGALDLAIMSAPNVVIALTGPVEVPGPFGRSRRHDAVALRMDDPAGFARAIEARLKRPPAEPDQLL